VIAGSVLGRPTAALWLRGYGRRVDQGVRADVLRHEVSVAAQAVARSLDLDDDSMVEETVEQRGGDDRITEDFTPFGKATVGGEDHGAALVAGIDELEEQIPAAGNDREVTDLVDDEQSEAAEESDLLAQSALAFGLGAR